MCVRVLMGPEWAHPVITKGPAFLMSVHNARSSSTWSSVSFPSMVATSLPPPGMFITVSKVFLSICPVVQSPGTTCVGLVESMVFPPAFSISAIPCPVGTPIFWLRFCFRLTNLCMNVCGCP